LTRSLIEQWLPAKIIGAESRRERGASSALPPVNFLHVWWARRPLTASRAAVLGSLLPAWPTAEEVTNDAQAAKILSGLQEEFPGGEAEYHAWFLHALGIYGDPVAGRAKIQAANAAGVKLEGNGYGYDRAFTYTPDAETAARIDRLVALRGSGESTVRVLDPFSGGGSIPFESARYGFAAIANELNPVASAILQGTVDLPTKLGPEFATTIKTWGGKWADRINKRLDDFFPRKAGESIIAYVWAHVVPCPTTGFPTPLCPNFWLARGKAGRDVAVRLEVTDYTKGTYELSIVEGTEAKQWGDRSTYKKGVAESIWTRTPIPGEYIRTQAQEGKVGAMLLAVAVTVPGKSGRQFRVPIEDDLKAVAAAEAELQRRLPGWEIADLVPTEPIFEGKETKRSVDMGLTRWSDMFTPRQLLTNITALEELHAIVSEARSELGEERGRAVGLYLALALDKACDYNGMLSSWDATRLNIRHTFDRHDFAYKWTFAEFDGAHSLFPWAVSQVEDAYRGIAKLAARPATLHGDLGQVETQIIRGSAASLPLPAESVDAVVTDPPYYDNVMYAECSDYFYVWLKRSLRDIWPQFCDLFLTDKEQEAVANPSLFKDVAAPSGRGRKKAEGKTAAEFADARYEELLTRAFHECHRVLKKDGVLTVMFTHKRVDAWDTLGVALLNAGFAINSSWPVHTESEYSLHQAKKNSAASTIFLTCRKREGNEPAYWADIRHEVERVAEEAVREFSEHGLTGVDLTIATYGPVLSVLSRNWPVYTGELDAAGNPEVLRPDAALDLARQRVAMLKKRGLLGGRDVEFDRITDWYLLAWSDFQAAEFPFDEARKLSLATHLDVEDLSKRHKVVKQASGSVTLLTPAQRYTAGAFDVDASSWPTMLDQLHALMLVYDEQGLAAAKAWLTRTGLGDDTRFSDLIAAALRAIPRTKEKGEFVRPEARILDSLRTALFDHIPPLAEAVPIAGMQEALFDGRSWPDPNG